jgi:hypothetical protein
MAMVGMIVRPEHRVEIAYKRIEKLLAQVGTGIDKDRRGLVKERYGSPPASISRIRWIAFAPVMADPGDAE